jgi:ribosomal protein L37AE/L43A
MGDGELEELDAGKDDLTDVAKQVLRDEMRKRGLDEPRRPGTELKPAGSFGASKWGTGNDAVAGKEVAEEGERPVEYTWKLPLCECEDSEKVWQNQEVLRQAGIESWTDNGGYYVGAEINNRRIVVAADQLDHAREVLTKPIPQEIVEQSKMQIPDYEPPACPGCGAADPILEGADPVNSWQCESCGKQWTEAAEEMQRAVRPQSTHTVREEENPFPSGPLTML